MAIWAYVCQSCEKGPPTRWYVAATRVAEMPEGTQLVRVRIEQKWHCAIVHREQKVSVDEMLVRDVVASTEDDCPDCREPLARLAGFVDEPKETPAVEPTANSAASTTSQRKATSGGRKVQAAAMAFSGTKLVVVLVSMDLVRDAGEADMAIDAMVPSFGAPVVLMAQDDEGAPLYHGHPSLVALLEGVPLEKMPWKEYSVA